MAFVSGGTNRNIASKPPAEYLAKVVAEQGEEALVAHCVPADPNFWRVEAYPQFLALRRAALAQAINDFISMDEEQRETFNLEQLIAGGESTTVEFESSARWDYRDSRASKTLEQVVVRTIAGFLNAQGGTLILGVDDDGRVVGLEVDYATLGKRPDRDGYQQFLVSLVSSQLGRNVCSRLGISFHPAEGAEVCVVQMDEGLSPAYVEDGAATRFYLRVGNTTQELTTRESVEYVRFRWPG